MWNGIAMNAVLHPSTPVTPLPLAGSRRYLALWFPFLSTDRAQRARMVGASPGRLDDRPFVLVEKACGGLQIAALDSPASRAGLSHGMALTEARALCPALRTGEADPAADATFLRRLADTCDLFTPLVALARRDGLMLDITGCAHLFGGEEEMFRQVRRRMTGIGLTSCAAIAGTPDAAWAFARYRRNMIAAPGTEEVPARALPIAALEQDEAVTLALSRAGFRTLGDLAERPSHLLAARFGMELTDRLHRILGREDVRITPMRTAPDIVAEKHFADPLGLMGSLMAVFERLAGDVVAALERRAEGGRAFEASFFRADGQVQRLLIETARPTRDVASLMRLMRLKIEALADPLDPGFGFDAVRLAVHRREAMPARQSRLDGGAATEDEPDGIAGLVDRLVARFGRQNVLRFVARDTHDPAQAGGLVPYLAEIESAPWPEPEPGQPPIRPLTLFPHPQPIEVLEAMPDGPPLRFRWRRVLHEVALAEGPERIAPEWWREGASNAPTRDYYRVENAKGHRFWIFREGLSEDSNARPRWFLHGLFA